MLWDGTGEKAHSKAHSNARAPFGKEPYKIGFFDERD